jgi:adenylate cyclase
LQPIFKAGANAGPVTVTEIGDIKRDLAFLGDTMNTAARIQGLCNQFQADLLISDSLYELLGTHASINLEFVDSLAPKGKQQRVGIYHVKAPEPTLP